MQNRFSLLILKLEALDICSSAILLLLIVSLIAVQQRRQLVAYFSIDNQFTSRLSIGAVLGLLFLACPLVSLYIFGVRFKPIPPFPGQPYLHSELLLMMVLRAFLGAACTCTLFCRWLLPTLRGKFSDEAAIWLRVLSAAGLYLVAGPHLPLGFCFAADLASTSLIAVLCISTLVTSGVITSLMAKFTFETGRYMALMAATSTVVGVSRDPGGELLRILQIMDIATVCTMLPLMWILRRKQLFGFTWAPEVQPREAAE